MDFRAETELKLSDTWLQNNSADPTVSVDLINREPIAAFEAGCQKVPATARGRFQNMSFRIDKSTVSADAEFALLNRSLLNHQGGQNFTNRYACGVQHMENVRYIYPYGTTARGISIYS